MRGGLDDALERLARRDKLRRRTSQDGGAPAPEVTELVQAVAAVVARNPELAITMGVEGAGPPVLLHFGYADGVVRVNAEDPLDSPRNHRDGAPVDAEYGIHFDLEAEVEPAYLAPDAPHAPDAPNPRAAPGAPDVPGAPGAPDAPHAIFEPAMPAATAPEPPLAAPPRSPASPRSPGSAVGHYDAAAPMPPPFVPEPAAAPPPIPDLGSPVPLHAERTEPPMRPTGRAVPPHAERTEPPARPTGRAVPLHVEPAETELAAKRLAAMLRADPSLLNPTDLD